MNKITIELTEDQARELIECIKARVTFDFKDLFSPNAKPSNDKLNNFRVRLITKLKSELRKAESAK